MGEVRSDKSYCCPFTFQELRHSPFTQYTDKCVNNVSFRNYLRTRAVYETGMFKENNQYENVLCHQKNICRILRFHGK